MTSPRTPSHAQQKFLFYTGVVVFLLFHLWMAVSPHLLREIPFEPDDHYHTFVKASHLNHCRADDCPGLRDLYQQIQETGQHYQANRRTHTIFYCYQPLYTVLIAGLIRAGLDYDNIQLFISAMGPFIVTLAVALFLRALFGMGAAGFALLLIAPVLFPGWGISYIVPITLSVAMFFLTVSAFCMRSNWKWPLAWLFLALSAGFHMVGIMLSGMAVAIALILENDWRKPGFLLFVPGVALACVGSLALRLQFIDTEIRFTTLFNAPTLLEAFQKNLAMLFDWLMFHGESFGIAMTALALLGMIPGLRARHPFSHILTLWAIAFGVLLHWMVRLLFETNNIFVISKPVLLIGWLLPLLYFFAILFRHPLPPSLPLPRQAMRRLILLFVALPIATLFFPKPDISLLHRMGVLASVFFAGFYGVCAWWVWTHAPPGPSGDWDARLTRWAVVAVLTLSLGVHHLAAWREASQRNQHIIFNRADMMLDAGQVRHLLGKAGKGDRVVYNVRDETLFYYLLHGAARLGMIDWMLDRNARWLRSDVAFLVSNNPVVQHLKKEIVLKHEDRLRVRPIDDESGARLKVAVRGALYGGVLKVAGTVGGEQRHTLGFKEERWLSLPVEEVGTGLTLSVARGHVRIVGVNTEENGLHWPWNGAVSLELSRKGVEAATIRFDPATLTPAPFCRVGQILHDRGGSVLSALECVQEK
ncbi:MAG: hypothetical protein HQM02_02210 [Magnetococcales bacterium]|nr:hypothetical protein [Magnetococcales bacterium]